MSPRVSSHCKSDRKRLQADEWATTGQQLETLLFDSSKPLRERLHAMVHAFLVSEREEAALRTALDDAAPLYRDATEAQAHRQYWRRGAQRFIDDVLPRATSPQRALFCRRLLRHNTLGNR